MQINVQIGNVEHGTRINQITVPDQMRKKISTGISFVDEAFGGEGMTPGTITLFTGTPGAGKSTLLLQLANTVSKKPDCVSLFNTSEESLYQTKMTCERLFPLMTKKEINSDDGSFYVGEDRIVDELHPGLHKNVRARLKEGKLRAILQNARYLQRKNPGKQLFLLVDSLQSIDDGMYHDGTTNGNTPVRAMELLTNFVKQTFAICVCIGHVTKSGEFAGKQAIKHMIDAHMHLKIDTNDKSETQGMRIFEMSKNRFGYAGAAFILNVEERGLVEYGSLRGE